MSPPPRESAGRRWPPGPQDASQALRAAHGWSPGGTKPARLGARRVCSWKAKPEAPPLPPFPSPRPGRTADLGPRAGSWGFAWGPSRSGEGWRKSRGSANGFLPGVSCPHPTSLFCFPPRSQDSDPTLGSNQKQDSKSPKQGLTRASMRGWSGPRLLEGPRLS